MKRLLASAIIMLSALFSMQAQYRPYSDLEDGETVTSLKNHVRYLSSDELRGRAPGSEGERSAAEYLEKVFKSYGLEMLSPKGGDLFGIRQEQGDTLTSRNVVAFIPGYDKSLNDRYIVIGAHMDNIGVRTVSVNGEEVERIYPGANGNASGMAMLLELARMLQTNSVLLRRNVLLIGFGSSSESFAGAWYFLNRSFSDAPKIDAMINLDAVGEGSAGFFAYTSSNADMNSRVAKVNAELQPIEPKVTSSEPFPSDHRAFYAAEIPSVWFTSGIYPERGTVRDTPAVLEYDTMERELEYVYNFSISLANGDKPEFSQSETLKKAASRDENIRPYYDCDYKPTFLGSNDPKVFLQKWVYQYLRYPQEAVRNGIQGRVLVDFVIDEKGRVKDVEVNKGVDPLLDAEAVRVIQASPDWKPARMAGKKVKCRISLYVDFKLERKK